MRAGLVDVLVAEAARMIATAFAYGDRQRRKRCIPSSTRSTNGAAKPSAQGDMHDAHRGVGCHAYSPSRLVGKRRETLKLTERNRGKVMHERVVGTRGTGSTCRPDAPPSGHETQPAVHMAHVPPYGTRKPPWTFDKSGTFMYGCLVPGHWEAGMQGSIEVKE